METIKVDGKMIRKFRKRKGWTGEEMAVKAGVKNAQYFYRIERNVDTPSLTLLSKIADALGVPATLFIEDTSHTNEETRKIVEAALSFARVEPARLSIGAMSFEVPDELLERFIKFILVYKESR